MALRTRGARCDPLSAWTVASISSSGGERRDPWSILAAPGADLGNDDEIVGIGMMRLADQGLGAPVASIGGAGTFDRIFLTAMLAVLIAGNR
jgi:uncharacterized membrane protein